MNESATEGVPEGSLARAEREVATDPWAELARVASPPAPGQEAREAWLSDLEVDGKHQLLFELELLLEGIACFANPRNHPGRALRPKLAASDWSWHLSYLRDGIARAAVLAAQLLGDRARPLVTARYFDGKPWPGERPSHRREAQTGVGSPDDSLLALRHALLHALAVADGTLALQRVPFRLFYAQASLIAREVARSPHFSPLPVLQARPQLADVDARAVLALVRAASGESPRKLVALTVLSLLRMAHELRLIGDVAGRATDGARQRAGRIYLILAALRSEARSLAFHLRDRAPRLLAESFEDEVFAAPALDLAAREEALLARARSLSSMSFALEGAAASLRIEVRRTYRHAVPAPDTGMADEELLAQLHRAADELHGRLQKIIAIIARSLGAVAPVVGAPDDDAAGERVRREVWMFAQIVRAFASKADAARSADERWGAVSGLAFVSEFNAYFQALGRSVLQATDYPRLDDLVRSVQAVVHGDLTEREALQRLALEARSVESFLAELFASLAGREDLRGVPFDRGAAALALRRYLGD